MSTLKKFAGQTLIYGLSTIVARLFNFILTPIFVNKYPVAVYGIFTTVYAWAAIINAILAFGMETTFFRFLQKEKENQDKVYNNTFLIILFLVFVFVSSTLLFTPSIAAWVLPAQSAADAQLYIQFFIYILSADALAVVPFAKIRAEEKPLRFGVIKMINIVIFVGFSLFFILFIPELLKNNGGIAEWIRTWYRPGWIGYVFIANLIASVVTLLLLFPEISKLRLRPDADLLKKMLWYSSPVLIANISFIISEILDKIFLSKLLPPEVSEIEIGIYGAVQKIAIFLSIFNQAFRFGAEPFFFSHSKHPNSGKTYALVMDYFIIFMALAVVGITANIELLKYFIKGGTELQQMTYWSGLPVVPVLLLGYLCLGVYMNLSIWYKLSDQTKYGLYISVMGALLTIVLNFLLIPSFGYKGSAWITLLVYFSMMSLSYLWGQKHYPIPYHIKKNILYISAAALLSWISFSVFNRNLLIGNLLFFGFASLALWNERHQIKHIISK